MGKASGTRRQGKDRLQRRDGAWEGREVPRKEQSPGKRKFQ